MNAVAAPSRLLHAWCARGVVLALAGGLSVAAPAAEPTLRTAWMRPAAAGTTAKAYVDIVSDTPLTLVRASSPAAKRVDIVVVAKTDGSDEGKVVRALPVAAGTPTRLAYLGNHLRLTGLRQEAANGSRLPLLLEFRDAKGRRSTARTEIEVRGLLRPGSAPVPFDPNGGMRKSSVPDPVRPQDGPLPTK